MLAMIGASLFIAALAVAQSNDVKKKATKIPPTAPTSQSDADAKKHVAEVKYEDRQAKGVQTLDGASKDAAKGDSVPAKTGGQDVSSTTQNSGKQ